MRGVAEGVAIDSKAIAFLVNGMTATDPKRTLGLYERQAMQLRALIEANSPQFCLDRKMGHVTDAIRRLKHRNLAPINFT